MEIEFCAPRRKKTKLVVHCCQQQSMYFFMLARQRHHSTVSTPHICALALQAATRKVRWSRSLAARYAYGLWHDYRFQRIDATAT